MENKNVIIGIDVSKEKLDISFNNKHYQYDNSESGIKSLIAFAKKHQVTKMICEATGGYEINLIYQCNSSGIKIARVNPRNVRDFARASGKLAKTDIIDAKTLVEFANTFATQDTDITSQLAMSELTRYRQNLVTERCNILKRHHKTHSEFIRNSLEKMLEYYEDEIAACDAEISKQIQSDTALQQKEEILRSFCGVGEVTASVLLAEMPELGEIDSQKIAALAGLAPYNADSGKKTGKRQIRGGRKPARDALYMAAMVAARRNKKMKEFYERLQKKNKPFKVIVTAVMRKTIVTLNAMIKNNQKWSENYVMQV